MPRRHDVARVRVVEDARLREGVEDHEAQPVAATPTSTAEVVEWFSVAFDEIVELIVRDSWGRFTASSMFGEFMTLFNSERQLDKTLSRVDQGPSTKRTDSGACNKQMK